MSEPSQKLQVQIIESEYLNRLTKNSRGQMIAVIGLIVSILTATGASIATWCLDYKEAKKEQLIQKLNTQLAASGSLLGAMNHLRVTYDSLQLQCTTEEKKALQFQTQAQIS